jgi:malonyl-CoA O-methyltransferase
MDTKPTKTIQKEFSKYAPQYNNHNVIQQIVSKAIIRDINKIDQKPKRILELGCGSGQIFSKIDFDFEYYKAIDFSQQMCDLHPKAKNLQVQCVDFDSLAFHNMLQNEKYDLTISASALQWSKDLSKILKTLSKTTKYINMALFTSNTFKSIFAIAKQYPPILSKDEIVFSFLKYFDIDYEVINYNLQFQSKKELFDYIKKSGVSASGDFLNFATARKLYNQYMLDYLEFEVVYINNYKDLIKC